MVGPMSEREDLFAIYGAIDRAVAGDRKLQDVVSKFLPEYNDADAIGWFDEFERWAGRIPGTSPLPEFEDALRNLAGQSTTGRMAARRLLVMAVAARVFDTNTDES